MKRYISKVQHLNECIILASKFKDDHIILAKNRDRTYVPQMKIVHMIKDDTEIAFVYDVDTGWAEGLNEFGIGITNTALMVGHDEEEKKIVKKTGEKSKDGKKIIKALTYEKFEDVVESVVKYKSEDEIGVKGHTFVASKGGEAVAVELTSKHEAEIKSLNLSEVNVRTNHGHFYTDAGYTDGEDYLSSKMRKAQAEKIPQNIGPKGILNYLKKRNYKDTSNLNMNRNTDYMKTTGQVLMDLTDLTLYYDAMNGKSEFIEIDNRLPDNYEPKISIVVYGDKEDTVEKTTKNDKKEERTMKRYEKLFREKEELDITDILNRKFSKLINKEVKSFGGKEGLYGINKDQINFIIKNIEFDNTTSEDIMTTFNILLKDYNSSKYGLIYTDPTFLDSFSSLLQKINVNPKDVDYSEQGLQGKNSVGMELNHIKKYIK